MQLFDHCKGENRSWPERVGFIPGLFGRRCFDLQYVPGVSGDVDEGDCERPAFGPLYWLLVWFLFFDHGEYIPILAVKCFQTFDSKRPEGCSFHQCAWL
jgi:hypothetical protein